MSTAKTLVSIPVTCSRTGKIHNTPMPLDEVTGYLAKQDAKITTGDALSSVVKSADTAPDLVILWKGKLHILNTVHESNDAAIGRYVNAILKDEAYEVPEPRVRTPKDPNAAPAEASDETPKKRGRKPKNAPAASAEAPADGDGFDLVVDET